MKITKLADGTVRAAYLTDGTEPTVQVSFSSKLSEPYVEWLLKGCLLLSARELPDHLELVYRKNTATFVVFTATRILFEGADFDAARAALVAAIEAREEPYSHFEAPAGEDPHGAWLQFKEAFASIWRDPGRRDQQREAIIATARDFNLPESDSPYLPHQGRVIREKAELDEKIDRLYLFINSPKFQDLPLVEQELLTRQERAMRHYTLTLAERIGLFSLSE